MLNRLIAFALQQRIVVAGGVAVLLGLGTWALATIPFEAFPDLTANSVSVIAEAPGLAPSEAEQLVTFPIERALMGLPDAEAVRSTTKFGLSLTQVIFADRVDNYFARQLVAQRLGDVAAQLPSGITPVLGPVSTAMGEVYQYVLTSARPEWNLRALKTLQDYTLAPQLRTVDGVAEVNSWGGETEQFHVAIEPRRLAAAGLTLGDVEAALAANNAAFGGAYTESRGERFILHGQGRLTDAASIARVPVTVRNGVPLLVGDLASVTQAAMPRQGAVTHDGRGEVVGGMVIMRKGENARQVIARIKARVAELERTLPNGVKLVPFYDQTELVNRTTHTIQKNLLLGGTFVIVLLWLFLRNVAASLIVAAVIPLSMLWAFVAMRWFGFSANLMSLGALDFGLLVDGSVVMVENIMRRSTGPAVTDPAQRLERLRRSAIEVGRPTVFGIAIIVAVYLPLFALQGVERKMFVPMAFTVVAALLGSLVIALTVVPAAARTFLSHAHEPHSARFERVKAAYSRLLVTTFRRRKLLAAGGLLVIAATVFGATRLGVEFMPRLDEGSVLVQTRRLPSTALGEGTRISLEIERALRGLPEVRTIVTKLGRPDLATEAMGTYESDTYVILDDKSRWRPGGKPALLAAMDSALAAVPGISYAFTQPIQMRLDEAESGITTDVGVKIIGPDVSRLAELAGRVERELRAVPGAAEVKATAAARVQQVEITPDRAAMARLGLGTEALGHEVERAFGASVATTIVDGPRRIGVAVRVPGAQSVDPSVLGTLPVATPAGAAVPLSSVARVDVIEIPEAFAHEGAQRMVVVGANVRGRDMGGFVADASARLAARVPLPEGYRYEWGGQYTHQQTAMRRLMVLGPLAVLAIFLLLYFAFGRAHHALLVMSNVPFALIGGVAALLLARLNLSLSAAVGFIALFGIAVLNGVVMVSYMNELRARGLALERAVVDGAATRLRPVLMTALAAGFGFVPMAFSTSAGAELQRPLATVVIGGLVTSTILTLLVLPTLFLTVERWMTRHRPEPAASGEEWEPVPELAGAGRGR